MFEKSTSWDLFAIIVYFCFDSGWGLVNTDIYLLFDLVVASWKDTAG